MAIKNKDEKIIKILLVEDDEDDFVLTRDLLQDIGKTHFQLEWAESVEKGQEALKRQLYDICLVDFRLGEKTGVDLIKWAKKEKILTPFIMLTGENDRDTDLLAMKVGAYDYLMKSNLDSTTLERTIRYTLERKRTEDKLLKAEEKYRSYFENAIEGIFQTSVDGKFLSVNPALAKICGYDTPEEMIRSMTTIEKVYVKNNRRQHLIDTLKKQGVVSNYQSQIYTKNKSIIWITENARTVYNNDGSIKYFEGTVQDITARKEAEQEREKLLHAQIARTEAEAAQRRLQYLADASRILSTSLAYKKTFANVAKLIVPAIADWCTIDTVKPDGGINNLILFHKNPKKQQWGQQLRKIYPTSSKSTSGIYTAISTKRAQLYSTISVDQLKQTAVDSVHFKILKDIGMKSVMIVPMIAHQEVLGVISFIRSESNESFTNEDLLFAQELAARAATAIDNAHLYEQAQEGIRVRDEFLNIASHELKTPLTSLQLQMQILLKMIHDKNKTLSQDALDHLLKSSTKQIKRLSQLINDLLDVSRLSNKELDISPEEVTIQEIVNDVLDRFSEAIKNSGSKIKVDQATPIVGVWDKSRIDQVLTNLLSNAIKYGEGNPIKIKITKKDHHAELTIQDKGLGMSQEETETIFQKFERTVAAKKYGGVGLGLYIVNEIIKAHDGSISVESNKGEGSTFIVKLPLHPHNTSAISL